MTGRVIQTDLECGNCGRKVTEINLNARTGSCVFCDINEEK